MARTGSTQRPETAEPTHRITAVGLELTPSQRSLIERELERLGRSRRRLPELAVTVQVPHLRPQAGVIEFEVTVRAVGPRARGEVVRKQAAEVETAVQSVFKAAERVLGDARRRRWSGRAEGPPEGLGVVQRVFRYEGYGFLTDAEGREVYFHRNSVAGGGFDQLEPGTRVRFSAAEGDDGPQASSVSPA